MGRALNWSVAAVALPSRSNWAMPGSEGQSCTSTPSLKWRCRSRRRHGESEMRRVHAHLCPNMTACEELVRHVAPVDHAIYAHAIKYFTRVKQGHQSGMAESTHNVSPL